ncbi:MAG: hydantoinase/oxoprolinase family protein [Armatimonadetes bacterium]|nr:hydantoinase/oxoprolinase family protein [Armatimonadota bacterium]
MTQRVIGVEVGGTFTDWVLTEDGRIVRVGKVFSVPKRPDEGVMNAIADAGVALTDLSAVVHGSTIATNAVLERKGAVTTLITTEGFRDLLAIQRQAKQRLFDLFYKQPEALVPRDRIVEAEEKMASDGTIRRPLVMNGLLDDLGRVLKANEVESLAICLLHGYANSVHEEALESAIADRFPDLFITRASDLLPQFREYERTSTVVMSAYTRPVVDRYLSRLEQRLKEGGCTGPLNIIQANGGSVPSPAIRRHAVKMILSGPAAGVIGAVAAAKSAGFENVITFDMGGTSTDVCLVTDGQPKTTTDYRIDGLPLAIPMIDIVTVGAGGGSIAGVDAGGILKVGPESAGADPGPACYGRGGQSFTVTDANAILGFIRPHAFFGGKLTLDMKAAEAALDRLSKQLKLGAMEAAEGVRRFVNFTMAQAMRLVSVERGYDPRDYAVVAYGGGGPLHAAQLAEELGCSAVIVPANPGILSAMGLHISDTRQDFVMTRFMPAANLTAAALKATFIDLEARAQREFESYKIPWAEVVRGHCLDMRYEGQAYELTMPVDDFVAGKASLEDLVPRFHEFHRQRYGHASSREGVEIANFRLAAARQSRVRAPEAVPPAAGGPKFETAPLRLGGHSRDCRFYRRETLGAGAGIDGPSVVEEGTATTFVPENWHGVVDPAGNLILRRS